jgi:hypothetical protein
MLCWFRNLLILTTISRIKYTHFPSYYWYHIHQHNNSLYCMWIWQYTPQTQPGVRKYIQRSLDSWAWHRNCFNNIQSLYIRQQKYLNSAGNYFQNPLNLAILFIHTCYKKPFLSAELRWNFHTLRFFSAIFVFKLIMLFPVSYPNLRNDENLCTFLS